MKNILSLIIIIQCSTIFAQAPNWGKSNLCNQVNLALKHIANDRSEKINKVKLHDSINDGRNYDFVTREYVAFKLNTVPEKVFDHSIEITNLYFNKIALASYKSFKLDSDCIRSNTRQPNSFLSKIDNETLVINIVTKNLGTNEGESGITYLFCFKEDEIIKVFKAYWIS